MPLLLPFSEMLVPISLVVCWAMRGLSRVLAGVCRPVGILREVFQVTAILQGDVWLSLSVSLQFWLLLAFTSWAAIGLALNSTLLCLFQLSVSNSVAGWGNKQKIYITE